MLAKEHPDWNDEQLYGKAKLINSALMAKIHTVEWTPAILPHPDHPARDAHQLVRPRRRGAAGGVRVPQRGEILGGIVGSKADHHAAPYSLTEEFVAVYRMHPLIPDELAMRSLATDDELETIQLPDMSGRKTPAVVEPSSACPTCIYSFGRSHPGAITLHNYPKHLQNLTRDDGEHLDLAAVDIFRDRERGVPRYNQFRRLLHKEPVKSFDELTDNPVWREEIRKVYDNDLEKVDLMTGLYAEPLPPGFGFSETAFRIFVLMASRRLKSDRFFTDDYRTELYTESGLKFIDETTMLTVLKRHYPELAPALEGLDNAFKPWKATRPA